jgi:hypothetical protein
VYRGQQLCCGRCGQGDEPAFTLVEGLDYATECLLLTTVTSLALGLEWIVLIFMAGQHLTMNAQVRTCDGLLAPYSLLHEYQQVA